MIVPRSRLLIWVAVLVVPFLTIAAAVPGGALLALTLVVLFVVLVLLDAALAIGSLNDVSVELPKVIRLSKDRAAKLELQIKCDPPREREIRLGLALPREIHSPAEDLFAQLPAKSALSRVEWPCVPLRRGNYPLVRCHLEASSPWGFWAVRGTTLVSSELRVYPNLATEGRSVAALFLNRGAFGVHVQRQVGKGRDFEKLREYTHGDSYDEIHWKATAKRGKPVTKVFQIERTQEVYVIVDASRLSARPAGQGKCSVFSNQSSVRSGGSGADGRAEAGLNTEHGLLNTTSVLERYLTAALVLGLAAERQGDLFGLLTFSDKVLNFVRAKNGKAHYSACRDAIYTLHPQTVSPDFDELASFIRLRLRKRALLVFLTALDDPVLAESFVRNMDLICRQHLILVNMMQPPGVQPLFSDPNVESLDGVYLQLGGHVLWHNLRELEKVLKNRGVRFSLVNHERLSAQLVTQYLGVKQRQLL